MWKIIENDVEGFLKAFWTWLVNFFDADILPDIQALEPIVLAAAQAYMTDNPGELFTTKAIDSIWTAVLPSLTGDQANVEFSLFNTVLSTLAGTKLNWPSPTTGNAGNMPGGSSTGT